MDENDDSANNLIKNRNHKSQKEIIKLKAIITQILKSIRKDSSFNQIEELISKLQKWSSEIIQFEEIIFLIKIKSQRSMKIESTIRYTMGVPKGQNRKKQASKQKTQKK